MWGRSARHTPWCFLPCLAVVDPFLRRVVVLDMSADQLKTSHGFGDFVYWNLFIAIPFVTACIAISKSSTVGMIAYIIASILILSVGVFKSFCTHCPHYVQSKNTVKCMFLRGIPKCFTQKAGPYDLVEQVIVAISLIVWIVIPIYWLCLHPGLLAIYFVSLIVFGATVRRYECIRCIHFHCPANSVPEDVKSRSLDTNPHLTNHPT
jgi:hypothetical protein